MDEMPDGRSAMAEAVATLAMLLDRRVEAVDVGHSGGTRVLAGPAGLERQVVTAEAALVPMPGPGAPDDRRTAMGLDAAVEDIAGWSAIRTDPFTLADRLRNLRLAPWRDASGDGARLRLAALRAALARLDRVWRERPVDAERPGDLVVCSGGAFAAVPPAAAALAVVDGMRERRVSATCSTITRGSSGPSGPCPMPATADASSRTCWTTPCCPSAAPSSSATARSPVERPSRCGSRATSPGRTWSCPAGDVHVLDLPPGVPARVELASREMGLLGLRSRRVAVEVTGGLGGLLVDTRDVPLRLPDRVERRRAQLEAWEHAVWSADR